MQVLFSNWLIFRVIITVSKSLKCAPDLQKTSSIIFMLSLKLAQIGSKINLRSINLLFEFFWHI